MTEYEELMDILSHLPPERQEAIKFLASERASQYCDKYDNHLPDFKDAAYNYELSKLTRDVVYQSVMTSGTIEGASPLLGTMPSPVKSPERMESKFCIVIEPP